MHSQYHPPFMDLLSSALQSSIDELLVLCFAMLESFVNELLVLCFAMSESFVDELLVLCFESFVYQLLAILGFATFR